LKEKGLRIRKDLRALDKDFFTYCLEVSGHRPGACIGYSALRTLTARQETMHGEAGGKPNKNGSVYSTIL
jgi:hypothetical protein